MGSWLLQPRIRRLLPLLILAFAGCGEGSRSPTAPEPAKPSDAIDFILDSFDRHPIVALDEGDHQSREVHQFIVRLVRDPRFAGEAKNIVVEFAGALHQGLLDDYVSGGAVSERELALVWRGTTQLLTWDSPVYRRFFQTVRDVNQGLPPGDRIRVLGGDPPIDWSQVKTHEDAMRFSDRDGHFAEVVRREVLERGGRALLIAGGGHLYRKDAEPNVVTLLADTHPEEILVVKTHDPQSGAVESLVSAWPKPGIALLKGSALGQTAAGALIPVFAETGYRLEEVADAYLYVSPFDRMAKVRPSPEIYADEDYCREVERRFEIVFQEPFPQEVWTQLREPRQ